MLAVSVPSPFSYRIKHSSLKSVMYRVYTIHAISVKSFKAETCTYCYEIYQIAFLWIPSQIHSFQQLITRPFTLRSSVSRTERLWCISHQFSRESKCWNVYNQCNNFQFSRNLYCAGCLAFSNTRENCNSTKNLRNTVFPWLQTNVYLYML